MILKLDIFNTSEVAGDNSPAYSANLPDGMATTKSVTQTVEKQVEISGEITHVLVDVERQYEPVYETEVVDEIETTVIIGYIKPIFGEEGEILSLELVKEPGTFTVQVDQVVQGESTFKTVVEEELVEVPMTVPELIYEKYRYLTEQSGYTYAYADEFLSEDDIDLTAPGHLANTGVKLIELLPGGMCITKPISLDIPADKFKLYLEADEGITVQLHDIDDQGAIVGIHFTDLLSLTIPINKFCLSFHNTTGKNAKVHAYALFYEGV